MQNPEFDHMNSIHVIVHNSLKTSPNDIKFVPLESLDIGLQLWLRPQSPEMPLSKSNCLPNLDYKTY